MPVHYEVRRRIATITLDRPEHMNALDPPMMFGLAEAWDRAEDDDDVWVVVLTGKGDAFCAGADMRNTVPNVTGEARGIEAELAARFPNMSRTLLRDRFFEKPIVAAVNGHCIAGGLELLLSTDLRYTAPAATFGLQQVRWGLFPLAGATVNLPREIGHCRAMELLMLGDRIDAETAVSIGLVNAVVPAGELTAWALDVAERLCHNGPVAVRKVKEAVVRGRRLPVGEALALELRLGAEVFATHDAEEGVRAFVEKRDPTFEGR